MGRCCSWERWLLVRLPLVWVSWLIWSFAWVVGPIVPGLAFTFPFSFALALTFLKGLVVARVPRVGSGFLPDWLREDIL